MVLYAEVTNSGINQAKAPTYTGIGGLKWHPDMLLLDTGSRGPAKSEHDFTTCSLRGSPASRARVFAFSVI